MAFRAARIPSLVVLVASGCTTGFGPKAVRGERPDYNQQIARRRGADRFSVRKLSESSNRNLPTETESGGRWLQKFSAVVVSSWLLWAFPRG